MPVITCSAAPLPLFMVVEYLGPSKSNDLLRKFPDNSALETFNYAQSSIWSPLLPRTAPPPPFIPDCGGGVSRKLTFEEEQESGWMHQDEEAEAELSQGFSAVPAAAPPLK
ncbi:hypothetical protein AAHA92_04928 [Salvia divinorum]|uniref:Serine-threonine/tyrosine-protein kinase catalytic domain-containing protein n=1 Tax=Salvia divinorum TaxID=28513 RepID=A0ABD1I3G8_SALDI